MEVLFESVREVVLVEHGIAGSEEGGEQFLSLGKGCHRIEVILLESGFAYPGHDCLAVVFTYHDSHIHPFPAILAEILIFDPAGLELKASSIIVTPAGVRAMLRRCSTCSMEATAY